MSATRTLLALALLSGGCHRGSLRAEVAPLPTCRSEAWVDMGRALAAVCETAQLPHEVRTCGVFLPSWASCPGTIRQPPDGMAKPGAVLVAKSLGGEWLGLVFSLEDGRWRLDQFEGGDIR